MIEVVILWAILGMLAYSVMKYFEWKADKKKLSSKETFTKEQEKKEKKDGTKNKK